MSSAIATTIPLGRTALRLDWVHLPPLIRQVVETRLGAAVVGSDSQTAGFTPGFASVLTCADGARHFVKAASVKAQRVFAAAYREEARVLRTLPPSVPAPRLQWVHDADDWVVLGIEYVEGRAPLRPWTDGDLAACSAMLVSAAADLTPAPGLGPATWEDELAPWPDYWKDYRHLPHAEDLRALAKAGLTAGSGTTLVHSDVRDDNLLIGADGRVWLCDWNWPVRGAAWLDSLLLLIGPRGDGLDVEGHIASHPLLAAVEPADVDAVLALVLGYFQKAADDPVPATSPYIRLAQAWQRDVITDWLTERRGW